MIMPKIKGDKNTTPAEHEAMCRLAAQGIYTGQIAKA
jgi:hypothetical protein